jgi:hypothetical protein
MMCPVSNMVCILVKRSQCCNGETVQLWRCGKRIGMFEDSSDLSADGGSLCPKLGERGGAHVTDQLIAPRTLPRHDGDESGSHM